MGRVLLKLFPEPMIPLMRAMCQPKRDAHSPKNHRMTAPEGDRLRLIPTPHNEVHFCGQLIKMGKWRSRSARKRHTGIPIAPLLVILRGDFTDVGKGFHGAGLIVCVVLWRASTCDLGHPVEERWC